MRKKQTAVDAKHGQKMIEVRIRFWTNRLAGKKDAIIPKHAWDYGVLAVLHNETHGITGGKPKPFNSLLELTSALTSELMTQGIVLHTGRKPKKLFKAAPTRSKR